MGSRHSLAVLGAPWLCLVLLGIPVAAGQGTELAACTGLSLLALPDWAALCPQAGTGGAVGCLGHPCAGTLSPREPWGLAEDPQPNKIPK